MTNINEKAALERFDNDYDIYLELIATFLELVPVDFNILKSELDAGNIQDVTHRIHQLKGASLTLGAENLSQCASVLEDNLRHDGIENKYTLLAEVEEKYAEAVKELAQIRLRLQKSN